ncbi:MAG TPA: RNA-binding cell elongation regulator Jag/EloR [Dehalococcoidia bacterium]|nr:RNA-binding cell elongation regulator Jag/EloR [Dehalococcoidia bacterium]
MSEGVEASGRTLDEAIEKALALLGLERDQVHIEVLTTGRPGLFGLGGEEARVRVTPLEPGRLPSLTREERPSFVPIEEEEEEEGVVVKGVEASEVAQAADYLRQMLRCLGLEAEVSVRPPETPGDGLGRASAVLDIRGEDLGILIGRRGSTLAALQYILNVMINRQFGSRVVVTVDVEGYKRRREEALKGLAQRLAQRVKQTGRPVTLEPMPAAERRIVHLALANDPDVVTSSIGNGEDRKVMISPRRRPRGSPGRRP